jgi:hypothetical protein
MAEAEPAVVVRNQDAGPSEVDSILPQRTRKPRRIFAIAKLAQMRDGRILAQKAARMIAQHVLFIVEDECH